MTKVLVIDDEPSVRSALGELIATLGLRPLLADDATSGVELFRQERPDVILLDVKLPGRDGLELLPELVAVDPRVTVIILTGHGDVPSAVQAMRLGAYDYLTKPAHIDEIAATVRRALERRRLLTEVDDLKGRLGRGGSLRAQMGPSGAIERVIEQVAQVAPSTFTVVVEGETGTGKELVARAIHAQSARAGGAFVALDCGAIPETLIESELFGYERGAFTGADRHKDGHFQLAEGGTLFLDEVVNLPLPIQAKLLRALQERQVQPLGARRPVPVDVRIIAASNVALDEELRAGRFRADLYYRLSEFTIVLPPLRERPDDIVHLARRFLEEAAMELRRSVRGIDDAALEILLQHPWPGNARELRNVIRRAALRAWDLVLPSHLAVLAHAPGFDPTADHGMLEAPTLSLRKLAQTAAAEAERRAIRRALEASGGNKSEAARTLRTDYKTLHVKMRQYGISRQEFTPA